MSVAGQLRKVIHNIQISKSNSKWASGSAEILIVSKGHSPELIRQVAALGIRDFGENYAQEMLTKQCELADLNLRWHFIGHLQSNKIKSLVGNVETIQSVDRESLGREIDRRAQEIGLRQKIFLEVNAAAESTKSGALPEQVPDLLRTLSPLRGIDLQGLMIMPPISDDPERSRKYFSKARQWLDDWRSIAGAGHAWNQLSMGTSADYVVALEEGATVIRLGTAVLGPRPERKE